MSQTLLWHNNDGIARLLADARWHISKCDPKKKINITYCTLLELDVFSFLLAFTGYIIPSYLLVWNKMCNLNKQTIRTNECEQEQPPVKVKLLKAWLQGNSYNQHVLKISTCTVLVLMRAFAFPPKNCIRTEIRKEIVLILCKALFFTLLGQIWVGLTETSSSREGFKVWKQPKRTRFVSILSPKRDFISLRAKPHADCCSL